MSSDKAQLAALGTHLEQQRTISTVYRAEGKRLAVAEVECIAVAGRIYTAAEIIEMAQEYEMVRKPLTDAEVQEAQQAAARMVARVEVVRAAIAETKAECNTATRADAMGAARRARHDAVQAFLAAGGKEATG